MIADPASGLLVRLAPDGGLALLAADGSPVGTIAPLPGYRLSHLIETPGRLLVVGQGEVAVDGWPDWHFEVDAGAGRLIRVGPAY